MAKPVDVKPDANNGKRELTADELNAVTGGDAKPLPKSNVEKKWSQTLDGIAANMK
jgi:bacteriocin-like protein